MSWREIIGEDPLFYSNIYLKRCNVTQFILSGNCSTCFGWYLHPSSGAQTTVSTASGICHTVIVICRCRGRVGTGFSVLWVAYGTFYIQKRCVYWNVYTWQQCATLILYSTNLRYSQSAVMEIMYHYVVSVTVNLWYCHHYHNVDWRIWIKKSIISCIQKYLFV